MRSTLPPCCVGIALLLSACQSTKSVEPLDSQSLIGVWSGTLRAMDKASVNTKMYLTIKRVTGSSVFGRAEIYPYRRPPYCWPFRGTVEGNELRIHAWKLTVFPKRMTGHTYGGTGGLAGHGGADIELTKESDTVPDSSLEDPASTPCR